MYRALGNTCIYCGFNAKVKVKGQMKYFLVSASPKLLDVETLKCQGT